MTATLRNEDPWQLFNDHTPVKPEEAYDMLNLLVNWYYARQNSVAGCDQLWLAADVLNKRVQYEMAAKGQYHAG